MVDSKGAAARLRDALPGWQFLGGYEWTDAAGHEDPSATRPFRGPVTCSAILLSGTIEVRWKPVRPGTVQAFGVESDRKPGTKEWESNAGIGRCPGVQ